MVAKKSSSWGWKGKLLWSGLVGLKKTWMWKEWWIDAEVLWLSADTLSAKKAVKIICIWSVADKIKKQKEKVGKSEQVIINFNLIHLLY